MDAHATPFDVRPARGEDAAELCELLNAIIRIGGTTALEAPLDIPGFADAFIDGPRALACFVAQARDSGLLLGFQALDRHPALPADWADIATFARVQPKIPGVGTALFSATRAHASGLGLRAINATIRADNVGGLAYYTKMGFQDYRVDRAVPLRDGTPVDRLFKRFLLA